MLNQQNTDLQAISFFQNCKDQLRQIAKKSSFEKKVHKSLRRIEQSKLSQKTQQLDRMLLNNIVIDFLRAFKLDYTYSVFMRQCNIVSEEVASKKMLAQIVEVSNEYNNEQRLNVSIIQLLVQAVSTIRKNKEVRQFGIQVDSLMKNGEINHGLLLQNKIREVREEVEEREKKYYEKIIENMKANEIMNLREQISKEYEEKYKKDAQKIIKKYQQLVKISKNNEQPSKLKNQIQALMTKNYEIKLENSRIMEENKQLQKFKISHSCKQTKEWKQMEIANKQQRKQLQIKKRELDLALRNISTKVQDLVSQKKKLDEKKKPEHFLQEVRTHKQNKDHMIETIHAEMRQMNKRIKILGSQNDVLRDQVRQLKGKMKENIAQKSNRDEQDGNKEGKNDLRCKKCALGQKFKPVKKDVMILVREDEINGEFEAQGERQIYSQQQSEQNDEYLDKLLAQKKKIAQLHSDMRTIKNKVRLIVQDF